jgi:hypothetical protein
MILKGHSIIELNVNVITGNQEQNCNTVAPRMQIMQGAPEMQDLCQPIYGIAQRQRRG